MGQKYTIMNYAPEMYDKDKKLVDAIHFKVPYLRRGRPEDAEELAKIFKDYGFKGLRVASNNSPVTFISLSKLVSIDPWRIIRIAQEMYFGANKRMSFFGNPLENPKSPFYKKGPDLEGRIEDDGQMLLF